MFAAGHARVYSVSMQRSTDSAWLHCCPSPPQMLVSMSSMLISLAPSHHLTCVDRFKRWPEAIPITSITAEAVVQALLRGWISRFSVPSTIITDCGRQFELQLWTHLMSVLSIKRSCTTAYHPQSNGMVA